MTITVVKMVFQKLQPVTISYGYYEKFREDLLIRSKNANTVVIYTNFLDFFETFQHMHLGNKSMHEIITCFP